MPTRRVQWTVGSRLSAVPNAADPPPLTRNVALSAERL
jgi:hypothetical protein